MGLTAVLEPVDRTDVRMVERREHLRFALETGEAIGIARERIGQDLQRDVAIRASYRARDTPRPCRRPQGLTGFHTGRGACRG